jgi:hypothetical protein
MRTEPDDSQEKLRDSDVSLLPALSPRFLKWGIVAVLAAIVATVTAAYFLPGLGMRCDCPKGSTAPMASGVEKSPTH